MKFSIAMATYNGEKYLLPQLESLLQQQILPDELIISDDSSEDNTIEIIKKFQKNASFTVKLYQNQNRLGFADNFLQAASLCSGDYIAFCDQDDIWLPEKIKILKEYFQKYPQVNLIIHKGKVINETLDKFYEKNKYIPKIKKTKYQESSIIKPIQNYPGFAMVFSKNLLSYTWKQRPNPPKMWEAKMTHDRWIYFLSSTLGNILYLENILVLHRRHQSNSSNIHLINKKNINHTFYEELAKYCQECSLLLEEFNQYQASKVYQYFALAYNARHQFYQEKSILKLIKNIFYYNQLGFKAFLKDLSIILSR